MPYKIESRDGEYCVIKESDGKTMGCHATKPEAEDQVKALYANEKAVWTSTADLPDSSFLFVESGEKDSEGKTTPRSLRHLPYKDASGKVDLPHLRNAIARANQIKLKDGSTISESQANALKAKAQKLLSSHGKELLDEMEDGAITAQKSFWHQLKDWLFGDEPNSSDPEPTPSFSVYKDSSGRYFWKGVYSNSSRDRDQEILTADAHKAYASLVTESFISPPVLQAWHTGGPAELGIADRVWYDSENDMAMALGHFYDTKQAQAEALSTIPNLGMSHGMPRLTIKRDSNDPSLITRYVSTELTVLPNDKAANLDTAFSSKLILTKEANMSEMTEDRKKFLETLQFSEEELQFINNLGKESKDFVEKEEETEAEAKESETSEPLRDEVVEALTELGGMMKSLVTTVSALQAEVTSLKQTDAQKIAEKAEDTPKISLAELVKASIVGSDAAKLDGRKSLAKEGPKETEPLTEGRYGIPFIDDLVSGGDWTKSFKGDK